MVTRKAYYKDGVEVLRPTSVVINGSTFVPPTDEQLISIGYDIQEVEIYVPEERIPTYEERVVELIRQRYTIDDELAILRQRDSKPEEFAEYNDYCEDCKIQAKQELL